MSIAISGTDSLEVTYHIKGLFFMPMYGNIPTEYVLVWY